MIELLLLLIVVLLIVAIALIFLKQAKPQDLQIIEKGQERVERCVKEEISKNREETGKGSKDLRDELFNQLTKLTSINTDRLDKMRETIEERLKLLQEDNSKKLEKMRETVDEKLQSTLEKRLGESFKFVSDRLEMVHKGLGEMQNLATGVGDLKKVLTNIKSRGTWGEMQLEKLLEEVLSPEQYEKNVATKKGSSERVEFAIKLPGKEKGHIWLPIDSKFPKEDYEKLVDAQDRGDLSAVEELGKALELRIKAEAKDIREKYVSPPNTTDFGIMFLPFEGLYAEVLRRPGLAEILQRDFRVIISGPTTIYALLNSLQMGFRTLAIEKRASEVWKILSAVIVEFGKFGDILDKTKKKLEEATNTIDDAARKSRTIETKLKRVQTMPSSDQARLTGESPDV